MFKAFLILVAFFLPSLLACRVMIAGEDKTDEFLEIDHHGETYVKCHGTQICENATITDCPVVECKKEDACLKSKIINFTQSVRCIDELSCHKAEIQGLTQMDDENTTVTVYCLGNSACARASLSGSLGEVYCAGVQSCSNVRVKGAKLVKCRNGKAKEEACRDFATFETDCMDCSESHACAPRNNQCRFKSLNADPDDSFLPCSPFQVQGKCRSSSDSSSSELTNEKSASIEKNDTTVSSTEMVDTESGSMDADDTAPVSASQFVNDESTSTEMNVTVVQSSSAMAKEETFSSSTETNIAVHFSESEAKSKLEVSTQLNETEGGKRRRMRIGR